MDGSQKLPQRLLGTIADDLADGRLPNGLILAVAAWMRYVGGVDEKGDAIDVRDPKAEQLKAADGVTELLAFRDIFGEALAENPAFRAPLTAAYERLKSKGARAAVAEYLTQS
jgi:fructuronate reductase